MSREKERGVSIQEEEEEEDKRGTEEVVSKGARYGGVKEEATGEGERRR